MHRGESVSVGDFVSREEANMINEGKLQCDTPTIQIRAVEFRGGLYKVEEVPVPVKKRRKKNEADTSNASNTGGDSEKKN